MPFVLVTDSAAKDAADSTPGGCGCIARTIGFVIAAALFFVTYFAIHDFCYQPARDYLSLSRWVDTPIKVQRAELQTQRDNDGDELYKLDLLYTYEFGGKTYESTRYSLGIDDVWSNVHAAEKHAAVARLKAGNVTARVNPQNPSQAVLDRELPETVFVAGAIGLISGVIGLVILALALARRRPPPGSGHPADPTQPIELRPSTSRLAKVIGLGIFAVIWNGIVGTFFMVNLVDDGFFSCVTIFMIPFVLVGLAVIYFFIRTFLSLFSPSIRLTLTTGRVVLGSTVRLSWRYAITHRVSRLRISLLGREEATYRRGTSTSTDRHVFLEITGVDAAERGKISDGNFALVFPADTMHTFNSSNNRVLWFIRIRADVAMGVDTDEEFPITVLPPAAKGAS